MAKLIKCSDCNKKVSINAVNCPNCGAPVTASMVTPKKRVYTKTENKVRKISLYVIVLSVLIIMLVTCIVDDEANEPVMSPEQKAQLEIDKKKQEAEKEAERLKKRLMSERLVDCKMAIQNQLKNPKSFDAVFSSTKHLVNTETNGYFVDFDFYAKNSFNAEIINRGICTFDADSKLLESAFEPK